jgi:hypothetical protein
MIEGVELSPDEWMLAPWRPRTVQPRPAIRPFLKAAAEKANLALRREAINRRITTLNECGISAAMSREEALFWFRAWCSLFWQSTVEAPVDLSQVPDQETTLRDLEGIPQPPAMLVILDRLYGWPAAVELVQRDRSAGYSQSGVDDHVFRRGLLPYLTEGELEPLRAVVRAKVAQRQCPSLSLLLAGLIDVPDVILFRLTGPAYTDQSDRAAFFGLGSSEVIARREWLRALFSETEVAAWLAHTGLDQLEWMVEGILGQSSNAIKLVRAMASRITGAKAAPYFLMLMEKNRGAAAALEWLLADPVRTLQGLEAHQWDRKTKLGREMAEAEAVLHRRLRAPATVSDCSSTTLPKDLEEALAQAALLSHKLPKWLALESLPLIRVGQAELGDLAPVCAALSTIAVDPLGDHPLAKALRRQADPASLDEFARRLFELWRHSGMPPKDRWAIGVIGLLGSEGSASDLLPHLAKWPGASRFTVAKLGYESLRWGFQVLKRFDSPSLLWRVRQVGESSTKAMEFFRNLAHERDLTEEQLEDLILPQPPQASFDFGGRTFELKVGPEAYPMFVENNGDRHAKPPKPNRKDDAAKAEAARERMKAGEKEFLQIRKFALRRLEDALWSGTLWTSQDFEAVVLPHPIYAPLCRLFIWGCFDAHNQLLSTFRVTEDGKYAGVEDHPFVFPAGTGMIGLPKPVALSHAERDGWRRIFDDYNLISLGTQLADPWPGLPRGYLDAPELMLSATSSLVSLHTALRAFGYSPVSSSHSWSKPYASARIVATLKSEALDANRVLSLLSFRHHRGAPLTVRDLDPQVIRDILADVSKLKLQFET